MYSRARVIIFSGLFISCAMPAARPADSFHLFGGNHCLYRIMTLSNISAEDRHVLDFSLLVLKRKGSHMHPSRFAPRASVCEKA